MSQLRSDLEARINERLILWAKDSVDLYTMAGLRPLHATQDVLLCVMTLLISTACYLELDTDDMFEDMRSSAKKYKERKQNEL